MKGKVSQSCKVKKLQSKESVEGAKPKSCKVKLSQSCKVRHVVLATPSTPG